MQVSIQNISTLIKETMSVGLVPMVTSSPGLGKSSVAAQIAKEWDLKLIDIRLSQCDPTDLNGLPKVNGDKATYLPMDTFPLDGEELPIKTPEEVDGNGVVTKKATYYKGWLILLDEINSAPRLVQAAAYKLVLDKQVGQFNLHKNVVMMAAGNLKTDGAIVNDMGTAMQSRLVHYQMGSDIKAITSYATRVGWDHRTIAYLNYKPAMVHDFKPDHADKTFACPRTWEMLSRQIKGKADLSPWIALMEGTIGEGAAREFNLFCKIYQSLPSIDAMIKDPEGVDLGEEPSIKYAISGLITEYADHSNISQLMKLVNRLPFEFQTIALQGTIQRDTSLMKDPAVMQWVTTQSKHLTT